MENYFEKLIVKFLTKEANIDELKELEDWLAEEENEKLFLEFIKTNATINISFGRYDKKKAKQNILNEIRSKDKVRRLPGRFKYVAAAILIGVLATAYFLRTNTQGNVLIEKSNSIVSIKPGSNKAVLMLENGEVITFEKGTSVQTNNARSNGEQIIYSKGNENKELVYNTLTIPRGGQFYLELSDGTRVWLNSDSKLKYPVNFVKGQNREIELVYGEIYLEVSPSNLHDGAMFSVLNNNQLTEVLGTKFNIKAYRDDAQILTTLKEGKVAVTSQKSKQILYPGQQTNLNVADSTMRIASVIVDNELAWVRGDFVFNNAPLKDIVKVLSRWYDIDFKIESEYVENQRFKGQLSRNNNLENILELIKSTNKIKTYEKQGELIIFK